MQFGKEEKVNIPENHHGCRLADAYFYGRGRNFRSIGPVYRRLIIFSAGKMTIDAVISIEKVEESVRTPEVKVKLREFMSIPRFFCLHHHVATFSG